MEGPLRQIVIAIAALSFLVFTVFFGRLPVFRCVLQLPAMPCSCL